MICVELHDSILFFWKKAVASSGTRLTNCSHKTTATLCSFNSLFTHLSCLIKTFKKFMVEHLEFKNVLVKHNQFDDNFFEFADDLAWVYLFFAVNCCWILSPHSITSNYIFVLILIQTLGCCTCMFYMLLYFIFAGVQFQF